MMKRFIPIAVAVLFAVLFAGCGGGGGNPQTGGSVTVTGKLSPWGQDEHGGNGWGVVTIYQSGHVDDSAFCVATANVEEDGSWKLVVPEGGIYDLRVNYTFCFHANGGWWGQKKTASRLGITLTAPTANLGRMALL